MIFDIGEVLLQVSKLLRGKSPEKSSEVLGTCMLGKLSHKGNELWSQTDLYNIS